LSLQSLQFGTARPKLAVNVLKQKIALVNSDEFNDEKTGSFVGIAMKKVDGEFGPRRPNCKLCRLK